MSKLREIGAEFWLEMLSNHQDTREAATVLVELIVAVASSTPKSKELLELIQEEIDKVEDRDIEACTSKLKDFLKGKSRRYTVMETK